MKYEIIVLVENLDECRSFYRDQLGLGEPVTESNRLMVFRLSGELTLTLEQHNAPYLEHTAASCRFLLPVADYAARVESLIRDGVNVSDEFDRFGRRCRRVSDPAGNVILLAEALLP